MNGMGHTFFNLAGFNGGFSKSSRLSRGADNQKDDFCVDFFVTQS